MIWQSKEHLARMAANPDQLLRQAEARMSGWIETLQWLLGK
jgi:hypothetical protein